MEKYLIDRYNKEFAKHYLEDEQGFEFAAKKANIKLSDFIAALFFMYSTNRLKTD